MPDNKKKIGAADRRTISEAEDYELRYFARRQLHRNKRAKLEAAITAEAG
jgi:hypothetical protein